MGFCALCKSAAVLVALGTWVWKRKEMGAVSVWQGVGVGFLYWALLISFFFNFGH